MSTEIETKDLSKKNGFLAVLGNHAPSGGLTKVLIIMVAAVLFSAWYFNSDSDESELAVNNTEVAGYTERGNKDAPLSEEAAAKVIERDHSQADKAIKNNQNYFGVRPNTGKTPITKVFDKKEPIPVPVPEPSPKPEPATEPVKTTLFKTPTPKVQSPAPRRSTSQAAPGNSVSAYAKRLIEQNRNNSQGKSDFSNGDLVSYEADTQESETDIPSEGVATSPSASQIEPADQIAKQQDSDMILALRGGHFAYGITLTGIDTDVAIQKVVAEIVGGELNGARLQGTWKRLGNHYEDLSLVFNSMELAGENYTVDLIAFSTDTQLPGFVSEVDRHILYRWGGLISGALIDAAKTAALASATIKNPNSTNTLVEATSSLTGEDVRNIFVSATGSQLAKQLKDNFKRPITSRVFVGQDMKLLAVEPVYVNKPKP